MHLSNCFRKLKSTTIQCRWILYTLLDSLDKFFSMVFLFFFCEENYSSLKSWNLFYWGKNGAESRERERHNWNVFPKFKLGVRFPLSSRVLQLNLRQTNAWRFPWNRENETWSKLGGNLSNRFVLVTNRLKVLNEDTRPRLLSTTRYTWFEKFARSTTVPAKVVNFCRRNSVTLGKSNLLRFQFDSLKCLSPSLLPWKSRTFSE